MICICSLEHQLLPLETQKICSLWAFGCLFLELTSPYLIVLSSSLELSGRRRLSIVLLDPVAFLAGFAIIFDICPLFHFDFYPLATNTRCTRVADLSTRGGDARDALLLFLAFYEICLYSAKVMQLHCCSSISFLAYLSTLAHFWKELTMQMYVFCSGCGYLFRTRICRGLV